MNTLNTLGQRLVAALDHRALVATEHAQRLSSEEKVHVVGAGGALTAAYEQLRNAAENTEEHLLLQNAIKRFYTQSFITRDEELIARSGNELAVELTLAGYLPNDSVSSSQLEQITAMARSHYHAYHQIQQQRAIGIDRASHWVLDVLAVRVESLLSDHSKRATFVDCAYHYFAEREQIDETSERGANLFAALHQVLLKSDEAVVRTLLLNRYQISADTDVATYIKYNRNIDKLLESKTTTKLMHIVDREGAPLRILRRMIDEEDGLAELLARRESFLERYEQFVTAEYQKIAARINHAIIRSVVFLIITKFLIGIAIEVPYDLWAHGEIIWTVLLINLLFPPLYMIALRLTHRLPGYANTAALVDRIDGMLYGAATHTLTKSRSKSSGYGIGFSVAYGITALLVFIGVTYILLQLGFAWIHIGIFFVFLSAASFLGFRLSRLIREIEVVDSNQNAVTIIRDIIYLPFVIVGRWMSDKYSRVNLVTIILDMAIELPLKTILRLIRQWAAFINDRKDTI